MCHAFIQNCFLTVPSLPGLPISNLQMFCIMITSKPSEQNGFSTRNPAAQANTASSTPKMAPTFPSAIAILIHGGWQWYGFIALSGYIPHRLILTCNSSAQGQGICISHSTTKSPIIQEPAYQPTQAAQPITQMSSSSKKYQYIPYLSNQFQHPTQICSSASPCPHNT